MIIKKRLATLTVVGALAATFGLAGPVNLAYAAGDLTNDGNGYCTSDGAGTGAQIQAAISAGCTVIDLGNNKYSITAPITLSRPITITNGELDMDVSLSGGGVSPLTVSSGGVTLSHLIIDGTYQVKGSQNADLLHLGNGSDSTQTTINDVHFTVGPNVNLAISGSATYPVVIEHCVFDGPSDAAAATTPGYKFHGFIYLTDMSDLTIGGSLLTDGNQFNGSGVNFLTIYVNIVGQSNATIENNQFTGPAVDDSGNYEPTSKYIYAMNTNSVIDVQNNTFNMTDSDQGVAVMVATSSQLTNFIGNNFNGFVADNTGDLPVLYTLTSGDTFGAVTPLPASLSDNTSYGFIVDYVGTVGGIGYFNNATITVSYDQNLPLAVVGTASNMPPTPTTGVTGDVTLDSADPTLIGYSFTGWSSDTTCDPANIYNPGDNVAFGADTTLYACWTKLESPSATAPGTTESGSSTSGNSQNAYGGGQGGTGNTGSTVQLVSSSSSVSGGSGALADGQDTQSLKVTLGGNQTGSTSGFSITTASGNVQLSSVTRNADGSFQLSLTSDTPGIYQVSVLYNGVVIGTVTVNFIDGAVSIPSASVGNSQVLTGYGFMPGEMVTISVHSDPIQVARLAADANGTVQATFVIPKGFALGAHTAIFAGDRSGTATAPFTVGTIVSTGGSVASTGSAGLAGLLVMAGLAAVALIWRRRISLAG